MNGESEEQADILGDLGGGVDALVLAGGAQAEPDQRGQGHHREGDDEGEAGERGGDEGGDVLHRAALGGRFRAGFATGAATGAATDSSAARALPSIMSGESGLCRKAETPAALARCSFSSLP